MDKGQRTWDRSILMLANFCLFNPVAKLNQVFCLLSKNLLSISSSSQVRTSLLSNSLLSILSYSQVRTSLLSFVICPLVFCLLNIMLIIRQIIVQARIGFTTQTIRFIDFDNSLPSGHSTKPQNVEPYC